MSQIVKKKYLPDTQYHPGKGKLILEAARGLFAHYGYTKVTMEEVADEVGVVKGSIYYYFPTKEQLFHAVISNEQEIFLTKIAQLLAEEKSAKDKIRVYVECRQRYFRDMVNLSQLDYSSLIKVTLNFSDLFHEFENREVVILQGVFETGNRTGEFNIKDSLRVALMFLHLLQGLRLRSMRDSTPPHRDTGKYSSLNKEINLFVMIFLEGIKQTSDTEI
ncbi:MAG: TetR/AcrR family transcriptional regulator [Bacteroidota bacterium]